MLIYLIYFLLAVRQALVRRNRIAISTISIWPENRWCITVLGSLWKITLNRLRRIEEIALHRVYSQRLQIIENLLRINCNRDYQNIEGIGDGA